MNAHAVIAVRGGPTAKSRLDDHLDIPRRNALVSAMLEDMLAALHAARSLCKLWLVTPTPALADIASGAGASVVLEPSSGDLNRAFEQARVRIAAEAPGATMILLPGDLPRLAAEEVDEVVHASARDSLVIARTRADGGTGALALPAACNLPFAFGTQSFARHVAAAAAHGLHVHAIDTPGLTLDVDRAADLDALLAVGAAGRTGDLLRSWKNNT